MARFEGTPEEIATQVASACGSHWVYGHVAQAIKCERERQAETLTSERRLQVLALDEAEVAGEEANKKALAALALAHGYATRLRHAEHSIELFRNTSTSLRAKLSVTETRLGREESFANLLRQEVKDLRLEIDTLRKQDDVTDEALDALNDLRDEIAAKKKVIESYRGELASLKECNAAQAKTITDYQRTGVLPSARVRHKVVHYTGAPKDLINSLNQSGIDGWRLVAMMPEARRAYDQFYGQPAYLQVWERPRLDGVVGDDE